MKSIIFTLAALAISLHAVADTPAAAKMAVDSIRVHYISYAGSRYEYPQSQERRTLYVNEQVTTHLIMPEAIKLVDLSTDKVVGNQCADNIVRIKPTGRMLPNEVLGTITVIGERHLVQYNVVYAPGPAKANALVSIPKEDMMRYDNPDVLMPRSEMAKYAWAIYGSSRKFYNIHSSAYGIKAVINNIYSVNDYFFIDFSLYNSTKIKYDIDEIRVKLTDKKEVKATNSQTIELTPVFSLNRATSFKKGYRNVIVLDKLTFPDEKVLRLEISEHQISGRVICIPIEYADILHADSFDESLLKKLDNNYYHR
jgi:conjugative transposon TraN protein